MIYIKYRVEGTESIVKSEIIMQNSDTLRFLHGLKIESLVKKQNVLRLALAFNKYCLTITDTLDGDLWRGSALDIQNDIKQIRKWNTTDKKSIVKIMDDMELAVMDNNNSYEIPSYFTRMDSKFQYNVSMGRDYAAIFAELIENGYESVAMGILRPRELTYETLGTAVEYINLIRTIRNFYKNSR